MRQTTMLKPAEVNRKWYVVDATGLRLGRMATQVAAVLRGKDKPTYTPNVDCGDYVIIINADKVQITGDQDEKKFYYSHSQYPNGLRTRSTREMREKYTVEWVEKAVKGMGDIYKMAVPDRPVDIVKLADIQKTLDATSDSVLLIFKDVASAYTAFKNGLSLPELNVGAVQNGKDRKTIIQGVALSPEEYEKLKEMKDAGVKIFLQPIPENDPAGIEIIAKKLK